MLLCGVVRLAWRCWCRGCCWRKFTQRSIYDLRRQLFNHVMTLSLNFFDRRPIGELMSSLSNDTEVIAQFFRTSLNTTLSEATKLVFIVIIMVWLNWQLAIAAPHYRAPGVGPAQLRQPVLYSGLSPAPGGSGRNSTA